MLTEYQLLDALLHLLHHPPRPAAGEQDLDPLVLGPVALKQLPGELGGPLKDVLRVAQAEDHLLHHLGLQGVGQGVQVLVVAVKGGLVDLRPLAQLLHRDLLQGLLPPQVQKGLLDASFRFFHTQVQSFCLLLPTLLQKSRITDVCRKSPLANPAAGLVW